MKKMVTYLSLLFLPIVAGAQAGVRSLFPEAPTPFVTDAANILKPADITSMNNRIRTIQALTGGDVAIATLPTIGDYQPYEVAKEIGRVWGVGGKAEIGKAKRNLGVVILLVPRTSTHKGTCFIATGQGAEGIITDGRAGDICRDAVPQLKAGDYAGGIMSMINEIGPIFQSTVHPEPVIPPVPFDWAPVWITLGILGFIIAIGVPIYHKHQQKLERERLIEEAKERQRQAAARAKWDVDERERQRLARIESARIAKMQAEAEVHEKSRFDALTPEQQKAELEERHRAELAAAAAAAIALAARKKREAAEALERKKRQEQEDEEEERRRTRRNYDDSSSSYGNSSSSDYGSSSSDSFGGGGGFSGGGGGSDF